MHIPTSNKRTASGENGSNPTPKRPRTSTSTTAATESKQFIVAGEVADGANCIVFGPTARKSGRSVNKAFWKEVDEWKQNHQVATLYHLDLPAKKLELWNKYRGFTWLHEKKADGTLRIINPTFKRISDCLRVRRLIPSNKKFIEGHPRPGLDTKCGRGGETNAFQNRTFWFCVVPQFDAYQMGSQATIVANILKILKARNSRFLTFDAAAGLWYIESEQNCKEKLRQALRERSPPDWFMNEFGTCWQDLLVRDPESGIEFIDPELLTKTQSPPRVELPMPSESLLESSLNPRTLSVSSTTFSKDAFDSDLVVCSDLNSSSMQSLLKLCSFSSLPKRDSFPSSLDVEVQESTLESSILAGEGRVVPLSSTLPEPAQTPAGDEIPGLSSPVKPDHRSSVLSFLSFHNSSLSSLETQIVDMKDLGETNLFVRSMKNDALEFGSDDTTTLPLVAV